MRLPGESTAELSRRLGSEISGHWTNHTEGSDSVGPLALSVLLCEVPLTVRVLMRANLEVRDVVNKINRLYMQDYPKAVHASQCCLTLTRLQSSLSEDTCPYTVPIARIGQILGIALSPSLTSIGKGESSELAQRAVAEKVPAKLAALSKKRRKVLRKAKHWHEKKNQDRVARGEQPVPWVDVHGC
jgi:hypothetical protein